MYLLKEKIKYFPVFLFLFSIFIGGKMLVLSELILILSFLYEIVISKFSFKNNLAIITLIFFYLWHIIGYTYSTNKPIALFDFEVKLSLIIFSLFFLFKNNFTIFDRNVVKKYFIFSGSIISTTILIIAIYKYFTTSYFPLYTNFSLLLHPSYYVLYLDLVLVFLFSELHLLRRDKKLYIKIVMIIIILLNIYLSDSKSGYIASILIIIYNLLFWGYKKYKLVTISSLILLFIFSYFIIKQNDRFKTAFNILNKYENIIKNPENKNSSTSMRILAWNSSFKIIKNNMFIGVGAGDIKPELQKKYKELNYKYLTKYKLNVHNQFIETFLGQGLVGLLLLLLLFIIPFISSIKENNIILQSFIVLIITNFIFESMLNTQAGTISFGFFYSFLVTKANN